MPESEPRSLHLHTLDSLIADLVSGRAVQIGAGKRFVLPDERTRSALEWYRKKRPTGWTANVSAQHGEDLVDAILQNPPELPALPARPANANNRRLRLKKLGAHRFAGLHKFGTPGGAPENYVHEFASPLTLFEGRNGSGKTSLLNAIIWALTGEILRPQREPEAAEDFDCWVAAADGGDEQTTHKLSPLTPMPNVEQYRPDQPWVPADTWVELTFTDDTGAELPVIRRGLSRSPQGKLRETPPDLSVLGVDPIAVRIGTIMPGLLPLIKVGSESELGRAVSQLTGLSNLVDLAEHVRRARAKIEKEFVKAKTGERDRGDSDYRTARDDLQEILLAHPALKPAQCIPEPSDDKGIEQILNEVAGHFEGTKVAAFESARDILGERFDPANPALLSDLEKNVARAFERVSRPQDLASAARLVALRRLKPEQLDAAEARIQDIVAEAKALDALAQNPSTAARTRLYARVATWIADHPDPQRKDDTCVVCGGNIEHARDAVTGRLVKTHLHEAASDAALLSQTLGRWAENAQGDLMRNVPEALRAEMATDLPAHPCDLLRTAIVDELFGFEPFRGVLGDLKAQTASMFDAVVKDRAALPDPGEIALPKGCDRLGETLKRLDCAIRFARWRQGNETLAREVVVRVLGHAPKEGEPSEKVTLSGKLLGLETTVKAAKPVSDALVQCGRLKQHLKSRRAAEKRLGEYVVASAALGNLAGLGQLADEQVDQLRKTLRRDAAAWHSRIYLGAFPDTAHELIDTSMGRKGELDLVVQTGGVSAPAQHVTNASALRASLVAFFLAFWEHVLKERGGLTTLVLDDPEELLDDENRERLAAALAPLVAAGAQLIVTSYDPRFCTRVSRLALPGGIEHLEVHPATRQQPVVRTTLPLPVIEHRRTRFEDDRNAEEPAREFAEGCRVFFEAKLGDMFDDPAHAAWAIANPDPTLATFIQRLRPVVKASPQGMFSAHVFRRFVDHTALADRSPVIELMNKAHHGRRQEIRPADVARCARDLSELLELVEQMYEECYRWRRRDAPKDQPATEAPPALAPMPRSALNVLVCPDVAAFTRNAPLGESQESPERLDPHLLANTVAFYLRRPNFGFAAPVGSLAIVEAVPGPVADRRLVIARHGSTVYARRFVRDANAGVIGLTAEVLDPRTRNPKTIFLPETEVAIHQVVGIIFDHSLTVGQGRDEAVQVDGGDVLKRIEIAFRVVGDSAVPLALQEQVVLGGRRIELDELARHKEVLVALTLDDGSSIFKRVGSELPGDLAHLRQFESIGGLGSSEVLSIGKPHKGVRNVMSARVVVGVLYHG
ncbi:MAG TPA: ATP-binding protein [Stellaceae bacterium]|nr:ATP-binding protein [Stellaceae bacterium]